MPIISAKGGGFEFGASLLTASYADITGTASGVTVNPSFTKVSGAGADISIHAADHTKIDIATTGTYRFWMTGGLQPDTANLTLETIDFLTGGVSLLGVVVFNTNLTTANGMQQLVTTPPIVIAAGTSVQGSFNATTSAGTWSVFAAGPGIPDLWVYRLA